MSMERFLDAPMYVPLDGREGSGSLYSNGAGSLCDPSQGMTKDSGRRPHGDCALMHGFATKENGSFNKCASSGKEGTPCELLGAPLKRGSRGKVKSPLYKVRKQLYSICNQVSRINPLLRI
jgi:hypothetical protein